MLAKEIPWFHLEGIGKSLDDENGRIADAPLDTAHIGSVEPRFEGEVLLGPALFAPETLHIEPNGVADIHAGQEADV